MSRFFINRPIVAMVIAIITVVIGLVSMLGLPIAQFPKIVPPQVFIQATYDGADAETLEKAVATPLEQQMSGVDDMDYMYSINANNGLMRMYVNFDVKSDPNTDHMLTQLRYSLTEPQLPADVRNFGVSVQKAFQTPFLFFALFSPHGTYDNVFLANYAYINLVDQLTRMPGIASAVVFGAGQYAMRLWVKPDQLAQRNITVQEIVTAVNNQSTVNPAGRIGSVPIPPGQQFSYTVRTQGRLQSPEEFGEIVLRADPDGSLVRIKDVARIELGAQDYDIAGRLNGQPAAIIALFLVPGANAIEAGKGAKKLMTELKRNFPPDLDFAVPLDTTLAVTEGIREIVKTLGAAIVLVILVVFLFLQNWRATLIPMLAVPVSLIGTFAFFPLLGFSINTLSLFGLVLAIGLVVDDAIVVVEAVTRHIEEGMAPRDAAIQAMKEVSGPVIAIALILAAAFLPTVFVSGIVGRLYQQFAVTIAISVLISAFNALTLSPALSAMLLRPRPPASGLLGRSFDRFNRGFTRATSGYLGVCGALIRKTALSVLCLAIAALAAGLCGAHLPTGFVPEDDQGYAYVNVQLPYAASAERTDQVCKKVEQILAHTPGVKYYTTIAGFSLLSFVRTSYVAFFFVTLDEWSQRNKPEERYEAIQAHLNRELARLPEASAFCFSPPAIQGIGSAGGFTFVLEDRAGKDLPYLVENANRFLEAARKRPEIATINTTLLPVVPQVFIKVDADKALKQGVALGDVYRTLQTFMGGYFINFFNRFGRQWRVYVQAEGAYRTRAEDVGLFNVRSSTGASVPLSALTRIEARTGPEFTMHYNLYRSAQINGSAAPGYSSAQAMRALEETFAQTMPREMGHDYLGMSFQEKKAQEGVTPGAIFSLSLIFVFLILAALYESWSLPFSVLLGTPIAVFGAFAALMSRHMVNNVYAQIGLVMLIGLAAKNAILIVEFAKREHEGGKALAEAALTGARLRLRPILMTSFAFVFGCIPLWIATGAGAISRQVLGTVVIGGMLAATGLAIFVIPALFCMIERWATRKEKPKAGAL